MTIITVGATAGSDWGTGLTRKKWWANQEKELRIAGMAFGRGKSAESNEGF